MIRKKFNSNPTKFINFTKSPLAEFSTNLSHLAATNLTMGNGAPVADNQNSLTAGPRGPLLSQDLWLNEKLADFVREVIPERRMHAKGSGAFGTLL